MHAYLSDVAHEGYVHDTVRPVQISLQAKLTTLQARTVTHQHPL